MRFRVLCLLAVASLLLFSVARVAQGSIFNNPPVADPNGPYVGTVGVHVAFDGTGSYDPDGDTLTYEWDFGDGSLPVSDTPTPYHAYSVVGTYAVQLTVEDGRGGISTDYATATITSVDITVNPQKIPIHGTVEITITSIGTNTLTGIQVIDWLGNAHTYDVVPDVTLGDGDMYKVSFGPGVSGWIDPWGNPGADTSEIGEYDVWAIGFAIKFDAFEVIPARVPEFPLAAPILTSLAAALYLALRKRIGKHPG